MPTALEDPIFENTLVEIPNIEILNVEETGADETEAEPVTVIATLDRATLEKVGARRTPDEPDVPDPRDDEAAEDVAYVEDDLNDRVPSRTSVSLLDREAVAGPPSRVGSRNAWVRADGVVPTVEESIPDGVDYGAYCRQRGDSGPAICRSEPMRQLMAKQARLARSTQALSGLCANDGSGSYAGPCDSAKIQLRDTQR